jgi:altronate dehydratase
MRLQLGAAVFLLLPQMSFAQGCEQADFASTVGGASAVLSAMNDENKKALQARLVALKAREGWSDDEYAARATPFVKDPTTAALDDGNKALLEKVPQLGGAAQAAASQAADDAAKRCAMLHELRGLMARVVENTRVKWSHMLGKLDAALDVSRQAEVAGQ